MNVFGLDFGKLRQSVFPSILSNFLNDFLRDVQLAVETFFVILLFELHGNVGLYADFIDSVIGGGVPFGNGNLELASVRKYERLLHGSFSVGFGTHYHRLLVILERSGHDFGRGCRVFVHQQHYGNIDIGRSVGEVRPVHEWIILLGGDQNFVFGDEVRKDVDGRFEQSSAVIAKIENERVRPLLPKFGIRFSELRSGFLTEHREDDVCRLRSLNHFSIYGRYRDFPTENLLDYGSGLAGTEDFELRHGAGRPTDVVDGTREVEPFELLAVHFRNDVVFKDAGFLCGRSCQNLLHDDSEVAFVNHGAYAFEVSRYRFVEFLRFFDIEIVAVLVAKSGNHALNHAGNQVASGYRIETEVVFADGSIRLIEETEIPYRHASGSGNRRRRLYERGASYVFFETVFYVWGGEKPDGIGYRYQRGGKAFGVRKSHGAGKKTRAPSKKS